MSATYSGNPSNSKKDAVRFLIGDDETEQGTNKVIDPQISDQEISWILTQENNVFMAAAMAAETIATQYTGKPDKTVGPLSIKWGEMANRFFELAKNLRHRVRLQPGAPIRTGNLTHPLFSIGMTDNDYATLQEYRAYRDELLGRPS